MTMEEVAGRFLHFALRAPVEMTMGGAAPAHGSAPMIDPLEAVANLVSPVAMWVLLARETPTRSIAG